MAGVSEDEVRDLARLAHLEMTDAQVSEAVAHLDALLAYVEQLRRIDVSGVAPFTLAPLAPAPLRPDVARPGLPREVVLAQAPLAAAGLFEVPRVIASAPAGGDPREDAP